MPPKGNKINQKSPPPLSLSDKNTPVQWETGFGSIWQQTKQKGDAVYSKMAPISYIEPYF